MLLNNLDREVAERPEELIVYGGSGSAARSHEALKGNRPRAARAGNDETLLVQSGKPVAVFRTTPSAPRVLIANSLLVPKWATWDEFRRLEAEGLTMFGQMTAGSWIYIGTQGILQGTYQTFAAAGAEALRVAVARGTHRVDRRARRHGRRAAAGGDARRRGILCIEVDPGRIERRLETRYLDEATESLTMRSYGCATLRPRAGRSRSACSGTPPTSCPSSRAAGSTSTSSPTRRLRTTR